MSLATFCIAFLALFTIGAFTQDINPNEFAIDCNLCRTTFTLAQRFGNNESLIRSQLLHSCSELRTAGADVSFIYETIGTSLTLVQCDAWVGEYASQIIDGVRDGKKEEEICSMFGDCSRNVWMKWDPMKCEVCGIVIDILASQGTPDTVNIGAIFKEGDKQCQLRYPRRMPEVPILILV